MRIAWWGILGVASPLDLCASSHRAAAVRILRSGSRVPALRTVVMGWPEPGGALYAHRPLGARQSSDEFSSDSSSGRALNKSATRP